MPIDLTDISHLNEILQQQIIDQLEYNSIIKANQVMNETFGYNTTKTRLSWYFNESEFEAQNGQPLGDGDGIYEKQTYTAHVIAEQQDMFLMPKFFHEYFGHGLHIEKSEYGKTIKDFELAFHNNHIAGNEDWTEGEIRERYPRLFSLGFQFQGAGYTHKQIREINAEIFAIWTEYILTTKAVNENMWIARRGIYSRPRTPEQHKKAFKVLFDDHFNPTKTTDELKDIFNFE